MVSLLYREMERINDIMKESEVSNTQRERRVGVAAGRRAALGAFVNHQSKVEPKTNLEKRQVFSPMRFALLVLLLTWSCFIVPFTAQPKQETAYDGQNVAIVQLVAKPNADVDALRPLVLQKEGEPYDTDKVQSTVEALRQEGGFKEVDVQTKVEVAGLRVMFVLQPVYYIGVVDFPGALKAFSYPALLQVVNYPAQEPYQETQMKAAEPALQQFFAKNGYFTAQVKRETKLDELHQLANVLFHVNLGKRAKIGQVKVVGIPPQEAADVQGALSSVRARLKGASLRKGKLYNAHRLEAATAFIRNYLSNENRLANEVRLQPPNYDPATNRAHLTFEVKPGPLVSVEVSGARVSQSTLRKLIPIYEENAFDRDLVEEGQRNLISHFQSKGNFEVKVDFEIQDDPDR